MIFETSWDDGKELDIRLAPLLVKYNISATFYIPNNCDLAPDEVIGLSKHFEIGGHTMSHPQDLKLLNQPELDREILGNKMWLEHLIGKKITKFCYPRGRYNEDTIEAVRSAGFTSARTVMVGWTTKPQEPYRMHTTAHVRQRDEYNGVPWFEFAKEKFLVAKNLGDKGYFHLWGHSWEVEKFGLWDDLEKLLAFFSKELS